MGQSKRDSVRESVENILVGVGISMVANWFILPLVYKIEVKLFDNLILTAVFTVISFVRSYSLRRYHNRKSFTVNVESVNAGS